jgi:multidrug efflux pump subunit AcrA (membrane-fusion protein)
MRLLFVLASAGCTSATAEPPTSAEGPAPIPVRLAAVETSALEPAIHGAGRLRTADEVVLSFPFAGVLRDVTVRHDPNVRSAHAPARWQGSWCWH